MKSLAKNSIYNAVYQVLNLIFPLIASMYVGRVLMPAGIGSVDYAQNITSYFLSAAALGVPTIGLRVISIERADKNRLNKAYSEMFFLNAISTTVTVVLYIIFILCNPAFSSQRTLYIATGLVLIFNYINTDWFFKGLEEYQFIVIRNIATKALSLVALFLFVKDIDDYVKYAFITSGASCANYVLNILSSRKFARLQIRNLNIRQHIKPNLVIAGTIFFSSIYSKLDTTMLGIMVNEESVGYYAYAHKILNIAVSLCTAVTSAFLPRMSYYFNSDKDGFYALVKKGMQIAAFLAFPAAVGLYLLAPEAVRILYGEAFLPAAQTLRYFCVMILISAFGNLLCYQMMICSGNENKMVIILGIAAGLNVILNSLLIPTLHHDGAAIASVCTELVINIAGSIYIGRKLKLKYEWKSVITAIISSAIMGVCVAAMKHWLGGSLISFFICIAVGCAVYFVINLILKNQFLMETMTTVMKKIKR